MDAVKLLCDMNNIHPHPTMAPRFSVDIAAIPTTALGQSSGMSFVTKRDASWLVEATRKTLLTHGIEFKERPDHFICKLLQQAERIVSSPSYPPHHHTMATKSCTFRIFGSLFITQNKSYHETLIIKLRRLPMRKTYGIKVANVRSRSRMPVFSLSTRGDFADLIKASLAVAEAEA